MHFEHCSIQVYHHAYNPSCTSPACGKKHIKDHSTELDMKQRSSRLFQMLILIEFAIKFPVIRQGRSKVENTWIGILKLLNSLNVAAVKNQDVTEKNVVLASALVKCRTASRKYSRKSLSGHSRKRTVLLTVTLTKPHLNSSSYKLCFSFSYKRPDLVADTFFASRGCPLTGASTESNSTNTHLSTTARIFLSRSCAPFIADIRKLRKFPVTAS